MIDRIHQIIRPRARCSNRPELVEISGDRRLQTSIARFWWNGLLLELEELEDEDVAIAEEVEAEEDDEEVVDIGEEDDELIIVVEVLIAEDAEDEEVDVDTELVVVDFETVNA